MHNISETKAEFLLNALYPELKDKWVVYCDGTFYRNYNSDVMSVYKELEEVHISRDSVLSLLPSGMIGGEQLLRGGEIQGKMTSLHKRIDLLKLVFLPFDSLYFRHSLKIEEQVSDLLEDRLNIILKTIFKIDLQKESNPLIRSFAKLLPFVEMLRGDYSTLLSLLSAVVSYPIEMLKRSYSYDDSTFNFVPWLTYRIKADGLEQKEFEELYALVKPLESFIREWFVSFDTYFTIEIDGESEQPLIDYNIKIE